MSGIRAGDTGVSLRIVAAERIFNYSSLICRIYSFSTSAIESICR
jgi:hypothetical protein